MVEYPVNAVNLTDQVIEREITCQPEKIFEINLPEIGELFLEGFIKRGLLPIPEEKLM
jgi:hypothetical protein